MTTHDVRPSGPVPLRTVSGAQIWTGHYWRDLRVGDLASTGHVLGADRTWRNPMPGDRVDGFVFTATGGWEPRTTSSVSNKQIVIGIIAAVALLFVVDFIQRPADILAWLMVLVVVGVVGLFVMSGFFRAEEAWWKLRYGDRFDDPDSQD